MHYAVLANKIRQAFCRRIIDADLPEIPDVAARFWHLLERLLMLQQNPSEHYFLVKFLLSKSVPVVHLLESTLH